MARPTKAFQLRIRQTGTCQVRFTHDGRRYEFDTGERDPARAREVAKEKYADVIAGRYRVVRRSVVQASSSTAPFFAKWLADLENTHDPETVKTYKGYVKKHFLPIFESLSDFCEAKIGDYWRQRLGLVLRKTLQKELAALYTFFEWMREKEYLTRIPPRPVLPRKAKGVRSGPQRAIPVEISADEARRILIQLPEWSPRPSPRDGRRYPIRARFILAWETGLRPATLDALAVPQHYKRGQDHVVLEDQIDKARFGRTVPLTRLARRTLDDLLMAGFTGVVFGCHHYEDHLKAAAEAVLGRARAKDFAAYDFRHGRVNHLLDVSGNLRGTGYLVGHKLVTTTDKYVKPTESAARRVIARMDQDQPEEPTVKPDEIWDPEELLKLCKP